MPYHFLQIKSLRDSLLQRLKELDNSGTKSDSTPLHDSIATLQNNNAQKVVHDSLQLNISDKTLEENSKVLWSMTQNQIDYLWRLFIDYGTNILEAIAIFLIGFWLVGKFSRYLYKIMVRRKVDPSVRVFLRDLVYIVLAVIVVVIAINSAGVQITAILTLIGGAALGIGVGLQGGLSNFAGGLMIITNKPFKVGDLIETQNHLGFVEKIDLLNTTLKTAQHQLVILPNGPFFNTPLINHSAKGHLRIDIVAKIDYSADFEFIKKEIAQRINDDKMFLNYLPVTVEIERFAESYMELTVRAFTKVVNFFDAPLRLHFIVKSTLDEHGYQIPVPRRNIEVKNHSNEKS